MQPAFDFSARPAERRHTRARQVSREKFRAIETTLTERQRVVLTSIAEMFEETGEWATRAELAEWMFRKGLLPRNSVSLIAPRVSELVNGVMNRRTQQFHGGGVLESLPARPCKVAKTNAHPWRLVGR